MQIIYKNLFVFIYLPIILKNELTILYNHLFPYIL
jgi:hypothetical protein